MEFITIVISSGLQLILFGGIPFVYWWFKMKEKVSFHKWIGFKVPSIVYKKDVVGAIIGSCLLFYVAMSIIDLFVEPSKLATFQFAGRKGSVMASVLIYSFIQTGLTEEIFFRGFITKRFCTMWGFDLGNWIQAILFGMIHGIMLYKQTGIWVVILIVVLISGIAWMMGWLNEQRSQGSILPSWLLHSLANLIICIITMYNMN